MQNAPKCPPARRALFPLLCAALALAAAPRAASAADTPIANLATSGTSKVASGSFTIQSGATFSSAAGSAVNLSAGTVTLPGNVPRYTGTPTTGQILFWNGSGFALENPSVVGFPNPMTTAGDLILGGASGAAGRLAKGSDNYVLTIDETTHLPDWKPATAGSLPTGGTTGQVLTKDSATNGDASWHTPSGGGGGGSALPYAHAVKTDTFSTTTAAPSWADVTGLSVSITPLTTTDLVEIRASLDLGSTPGDRVIHYRVTRGDGTMVSPPTGTTGSRILTHGGPAWNNSNAEVASRGQVLTFDSPGTTSAVTYKVQIAVDGRGGTATVNMTGADTNNATYGHRGTSAIVAHVVTSP